MRIRNYTTPGTGPKYLQNPLLAEHGIYLGHLAAITLEPQGLVGVMGVEMARLAERAARLAPRLTGALQGSPGWRVTDDGQVVFDQPSVPIG